MRELEFIKLYCNICQYYNTTLSYEVQRQSNNFCPKFTDEECMATYIWGIFNQKFNVKDCYNFIKEFYGDWFPDLPSYQAFNKRICYLSDGFKALASTIMSSIRLNINHSDFVQDSIPIVVASEKRWGRAKSAKDLCDKGYCYSKNLRYYGIKLFILSQSNYKAMPTPANMAISKASTHDLTISYQS